MSTVFPNLHYFLLDATLSSLLHPDSYSHYLSLTKHFARHSPLTVTIHACLEAQQHLTVHCLGLALHNRALNPGYDLEPYLNERFDDRVKDLLTLTTSLNIFGGHVNYRRCTPGPQDRTLRGGIILGILPGTRRPEFDPGTRSRAETEGRAQAGMASLPVLSERTSRLMRCQIYATSEERKQRNRQAQAAFRERRTEYIKQLETTIKQHEETLQSLQQNHRAAADECLMLRYKNSLLERILLEKSGPCSS